MNTFRECTLLFVSRTVTTNFDVSGDNDLSSETFECFCFDKTRHQVTLNILSIFVFLKARNTNLCCWALGTSYKDVTHVFVRIFKQMPNLKSSRKVQLLINNTWWKWYLTNNLTISFCGLSFLLLILITLHELCGLFSEEIWYEVTA
jgi:hypothetical protein